MYYYTLLKQDGTDESLAATPKKWSYEVLREEIGNIIEIIPESYMPENMQGTVYGDEEARFNPENTTNRHMKMLVDDDGGVWDVVGDLILEQTEKEYFEWKGIKV